MNARLKKILPDMLAVMAFVIIAFVYFMEPVTKGKVLTGVDHAAAVGSGVEMENYQKAHGGEMTRWTNSLFCGMPTYQMAPSYDSTRVLSRVEDAYKLWLPNVVAYVFMMLLGFYIMLRAFNFRVWMAALGAVLWAFSSYYFIIIAAGHIWKLLTLCFIPPMIGGMVLCYRGKYLWGIAVTGIFCAMQILSNHVQMTYYFLFVIALMMLAYFITAIREKRLKQWTKATLCFGLGATLGVLVNLSNLFHTWQYSKESMRSKTELTQKTKDAADQTSDGLERSYITAWSYGGDEMLTLMIPDTKGGASMPLSMNKTAMKKADSMLAGAGIYDAFTQYHGEQPGTSGPVYIGAFVCFLFFLGLFIVRGPMKWCLLVATLLSILLSLGHNFMWFTDLFLDYVPMYDKFRTVASILVIAEFTMPLLALLALKQLVEQPNTMRQKEVKWAMYASLALTAGVCLLLWLFPGIMGDFVSTSDKGALAQYVQAGYFDQSISDSIQHSIGTMRRAMFTADCLRSFVIIAIGFVLLLIYRAGKLKANWLVASLCVLCLVDMWGVNKRYLNDSMFTTSRPKEQMFPMTQADELILQDPDTYYRVLNLAVSTFNDNTTSCYHKSIGGYHAAKLRRYQEVVEAHLTGEIDRVRNAIVASGGELSQVNGDSLCPVLNMLNLKYVIVPLKEGERVPVVNPWNNGNAWFVNQLHYVDNADEELAMLGQINTRQAAVANLQYKDMLGEVKLATPEVPAVPDSVSAAPSVPAIGTVVLTDYEANELGYDVDSKEGGVIVFSEIYYPGWTCVVDGEETDIARVNYVLRGIRISGGKHHVVMRFDPQSVHTTDTIAYASLIILFLSIVAAVALPLWRKRKQ